MNSVIKMILFAFVLMTVLCFSATAMAVLPPKHYARQAELSEIKAVAVVQTVKILQKTKRATHKKIVFKLEQNFGQKVPEIFRGTCYSVDHKWQKPGVGGTIYYYPTKKERVLVTILKDGGPITSYTPLNDGLKTELSTHGLENIAFVMGRARFRPKVKKDFQNAPKESWFLFHLKDKPAGYLHITRKTDPNEHGIIRFFYEFLVGELDGPRQLYRFETESRIDETLTPRWLVVEAISINAKGRKSKYTHEYGFRISKTAKVASGILSKKKEDPLIFLAPDTTTDFLLFELVTKQAFAPGSIRLNVIETLELNLKNDVQLVYSGRDSAKDNLHIFVEKGPASASYWLDDQHQLIEVMWDKDKRFIKSDAKTAMTILQ
jgi:hypothetical protein